MGTKKLKRVRTPRQGSDLRDVDKALVHHVMFSEGIVPIEQVEHDIRRTLKNVTPEEARKLKRKFRKLWRKIAKSQLNAEKNSSRFAALKASADRHLGKGKRVPSRWERTERKRLVFNALWHDKVSPLLDVFENPKNSNDAKQPDEPKEAHNQEKKEPAL